MNKRELQLFAALTNIGDDLVEESFAFLPAGGMVVSEGTAPSAPHRGRPWLLPVIGVAYAAVVATGILVGVVGNAFDLFPIKPPDVTTEEVTTEEPAEESTEEVTTEEPTEEETVPPVDDGVTLPETPDAGMEYQDKIIFVGDSLTAHLINRGVLTGGTGTKQVWRAENNMMNLNSEITSAKIIYPETGEKMTVAEAAALAKPEIMVITLGTDWGVSYLSESEFKTCYAALVKDIQAASPDTKIILQSIFPVTEDCVALNNIKIDTANGWVWDVAAENGCRYLDTQSVLKDGTGCLKKEYCSSADGIYLNKEAYEVILAYIRTHALMP
ncbi:MAG: hypothetical protein IKU90_04780 [Clostridia bacterium]|nr:hypothetical protein [Clostridia bacterium]